jgi:hypothetical protein
MIQMARGHPVKALATAPGDPVILDHLGMHIAASRSRLSSLDFLGRHAKAVSLAKLGALDEAHAMAESRRVPWSRKQLSRFALAVAPWAPGEASRLLESSDKLAAAASALGAGDIDRARRLLSAAAERSDGLQFRAISAAIASHAGDWAVARQHLDNLHGLAGLRHIAASTSGPLTFDTFPLLEVSASSSKTPRVSVLMAARNLERLIGFAIGSIRSQTLPDWELIVIDDASEDKTAEAATRAAHSDPRIKIIRNTSRKGAYGARNVALSAARGTYVTVLDGDDFAHPQRLETHVAILERGQGAAVVSLLLRIDPQGRIVAPRVFPVARRTYSSLMYRTDDARALGGYDEVPVGADSAMLWRLQNRVGRKAVLRLNQVDTYALQHPASLTASEDTGIGNREALAARIAYHERIMFSLAGLNVS